MALVHLYPPYGQGPGHHHVSPETDVTTLLALLLLFLLLYHQLTTQ